MVGSGGWPSERSLEMVLAMLRRVLAYAESREEIPRNPVEVWKRSRGRRRRSDARGDAIRNVVGMRS